MHWHTTGMNEVATRRRGERLAVIGALLQVGPVLGGIVTGALMLRTFAKLDQVASRLDDPSFVSGAIGAVLIPGLIGTVLGVIGLVLLCVALLRDRYRAEWFFWFLVIYGGVLIFALPPVGIFFVVYCVVHRESFEIRPAVSAPPP